MKSRVLLILLFVFVIIVSLPLGTMIRRSVGYEGFREGATEKTKKAKKPENNNRTMVAANTGKTTVLEKPANPAEIIKLA